MGVVRPGGGVAGGQPGAAAEDHDADPAGGGSAGGGEESLYPALDEAVPEDLRQSMRDLLKVLEGRQVSELERLRTGPMLVSGSAMTAALERAKDVRGLGAHLVPVSVVPAARMAGLARYEMGSKAPPLRDLEETRKTATLLATVPHLESASADDVLMACQLLARADRVGKEETLPKLKRAAGVLNGV